MEYKANTEIEIGRTGKIPKHTSKLFLYMLSVSKIINIE